MTDGYVNEIELRKAIQQLHPDGELFEVRVIPGRKSSPMSGYFRDADTLIRELHKVDLRGTNVYVTLQQIDDSLFSRSQSECFIQGAKGTGDHEVNGYKWLFIDLDPLRPEGISSTDDELRQAFELSGKVMRFMSEYGFKTPVRALSGNGAHLLYRISVKATDDNKQIIERCLKTLSAYFDNDIVKVDTAVFNPSRVCKLYGTLAQKGRGTHERPHRMSNIIGEVIKAEATDIQYLKRLAAELPEEPQKIRPTAHNDYGKRDFDIEEWLDRYSIRHEHAIGYKDGIKYILDECPFNPDHKAPDSMITVSGSGAIGFKCLHNSCSGYHWQDLRLKYEPDAYEYNDTDKRIEDGWAKHNRERKTEVPDILPDNVPVFQTIEEIVAREVPDPEYIRTGINDLDHQIGGLEKGKLTVLTGLRAAAKSTLLSQMMLNSIKDGHNVVCYSGELSDKSFANWIIRQAAGDKPENIKASARYKGFYYVEKDVEYKIAKWIGNRVRLYNNDKKLKAMDLIMALKDECIRTKADLLVIDNLMAFDISELNPRNEYDAQTRFMWELKAIAQNCNIHVILVAHPRKSQGVIGALRLDDISGTGNITNIVDNALIIHRVNNEFQKKMKAEYKWPDEITHFKCDNVLEIAKNREAGVCDYFIDLYFDAKSKRLKNYSAEHIIYMDIETETLEDIIPFD